MTSIEARGLGGGGGGGNGAGPISINIPNPEVASRTDKPGTKMDGEYCIELETERGASNSETLLCDLLCCGNYI